MKPLTHLKPIPVKLMQESFVIDPTSKSGLRRKERPMHHFTTDSKWEKYNSKFNGTEAGGIKGKRRPEPRFLVFFNGEDWSVPRIIWAIHTGKDPANKYIDHIDGNSLNNHISNLREVDIVQSHANRKHKRGNEAGYPGVYRQGEYWMARIRVEGKEIKLGKYNSMCDAINARIDAEVKIHGEFSLFLSRGIKRPINSCKENRHVEK